MRLIQGSTALHDHRLAPHQPPQVRSSTLEPSKPLFCREHIAAPAVRQTVTSAFGARDHSVRNPPSTPPSSHFNLYNVSSRESSPETSPKKLFNESPARTSSFPESINGIGEYLRSKDKCNAYPLRGLQSVNDDFVRTSECSPSSWRRLLQPSPLRLRDLSALSRDSDLQLESCGLATDGADSQIWNPRVDAPECTPEKPNEYMGFDFGFKTKIADGSSGVPRHSKVSQSSRAGLAESTSHAHKQRQTFQQWLGPDDDPFVDQGDFKASRTPRVPRSEASQIEPTLSRTESKAKTCAYKLFPTQRQGTLLNQYKPLPPTPPSDAECSDSLAAAEAMHEIGSAARVASHGTSTCQLNAPVETLALGATAPFQKPGYYVSSHAPGVFRRKRRRCRGEAPRRRPNLVLRGLRRCLCGVCGSSREAGAAVRPAPSGNPHTLKLKPKGMEKPRRPSVPLSTTTCVHAFPRGDVVTHSPEAYYCDLSPQKRRSSIDTVSPRVHVSRRSDRRSDID